MKRFLFLALALLVLAPVAAIAQPPASETQYEWHDFKHRLTIGATARYQWNIQTDSEEIVIGPVGAYELTKNLTLVSNVLYGFDTKHTTVQLGLTIPLYGGE